MERKKEVFWSLFSLLLAALSIWAVIRLSGGMSPAAIAREIDGLNGCWLAAGVVGAALFVVLEAAALLSVLKALGYKRPFSHGLLYSTSDIYFSAVTPSASGGQPASALFMIRDGIPTGAATAALMVNLIMYTLAIMVLGLTAIVTNFRLIYSFRPLSKILIAVGFIVLSGLALLLFVMLRRSAAVFRTVERFLRFLHRKKILRHVDHALAKLEQVHRDYDNCAVMMRGKNAALLKTFLWNLGQRAAQIAVPSCLYMAMGGRLAAAGRIFASQCLITIGYNIAPIPGAMGVADYLMVDGFTDLVGREDAFLLEMISRSITFYICVAICGLVTVAGYILLRRTRKETPKDDRRL